jgi:hypothetical protein
MNSGDSLSAAAAAPSQARSDADALDLELASRLNRQLAQTDAPRDSRDLRPALAEAFAWAAGAAVTLMAAFHWLA